MASSENSDLTLALLRVRVRNHINVPRGSINEYYKYSNADSEARLSSEQELDKVRETFEQAVRGSNKMPAIPDTAVARDEIWSGFESEMIKRPVLTDASNASTIGARVRLTSKLRKGEMRKEIFDESEVANKRKGRERFVSLRTPQENHAPRESAGLNFMPRAQAMSAGVHLNLLQKVRVPRRIRVRLSRILKTTPKSSPASPVAVTVVAEPADVGNLPSRLIDPTQCRGKPTSIPGTKPTYSPIKWPTPARTDSPRSLVGTGDVDKAAIFNSEGNSVWATTPGFTISPAEMGEVIACYKDNSKAFGSGFHIAGTKYLTIKADDRSLYGKQGKVGIIIVKTKQAMLIAHHPETVAAGVAANTVEKLGDYLIGVGY